MCLSCINHALTVQYSGGNHVCPWKVLGSQVRESASCPGHETQLGYMGRETEKISLDALFDTAQLRSLT